MIPKRGLANGVLQPSFNNKGIVRSMFSKGVQGVWYDPSDLTAMFQDAAGTIPVTAAGQPVGVILDKSKNLTLGTELLTSFDFTNWTNVGSVTSKTSSSVTTSASGGVFKAIVATLSKSYMFRITGTTNVALTVRNTSNTIGSLSIPIGSFDITFTSPSLLYSDNNMYIAAGGAGTFTFTLISIKEMAGSHAYQSTTASRPTLQQDTRGYYYLSFDGVDDYLTTLYTTTANWCSWVGARSTSTATSYLFEGYDSAANNYLSASSTNLTVNGAPSASLVKLTPSSIDVNIPFAAYSEVYGDNVSSVKLAIGARYNGSAVSSAFTGRIYELILCSSTVSTRQQSQLLKYIANKTGVTV